MEGHTDAYMIEDPVIEDTEGPDENEGTVLTTERFLRPGANMMLLDSRLCSWTRCVNCKHSKGSRAIHTRDDMVRMPSMLTEAA